MPAAEVITLATLAELSAGAVLSALASPAVAEGHEKVRSLLRKGPLASPLSRAFKQATTAFLEALSEDRELTDQELANLQQIFEAEQWTHALSQLPYVSFKDIDTDPCRELFAGLGPAGSDASDFDYAWRRLRAGFRRGVAESSAEPLRTLVELAGSERLLEAVERIEAHLRATRAPTDDEPAIYDYRQSIYERYRWVQTAGLFFREKQGAGERIGFESIFVETLLKRAPKSTKDRRSPDGQASDTMVDFQDRLEYSLEEPTGLQTEKRRISYVIGKERLTVILGSPGSGKSTLLRCLAMAACRPDLEAELLSTGVPRTSVPLLFELKVYASALAEQPALKLAKAFLEHFQEELPGVRKLLRSGQALVLFDGLDEVFDEDHRRWVSEQLWSFITQYPKARFVLTSRPLGYQVAPLQGPVSLWWMAPFDEDQIRTFFQGWFAALAQQGVEADTIRSSDQQADSLCADILDRERIRDMASNPLLCTLIVMVHRSRSGRLPERRFVFYQAAVQTLAELWERHKNAPKQREYRFPEPDLMIRALAEAAWRAFHELGSREIPGEKLQEWLETSFRDDPDWVGERGRRAVNDFLKIVQERTGLLVDAGGGHYQFVHLSLHEYLVARYILDRHNENEAEAVLRHYLHAPQWEEALQLLVGGAGEARAEGLVKAILEKPVDEVEELVRRDLRFVCSCLGDRAAIGPELRKEIYRKIQDALVADKMIDKLGFARSALYAGATPSAHEAIRRKLEARTSNMRAAAVRFFAEFGVGDDKTRTAVAKRLDDKHPSVRNAAVRFFAQIGAEDDETRAAVAKRLDDKHPSVRNAAVRFFAQIGAEDDETRTTVAKRLKDENPNGRDEVGAEDDETRTAAAQRLEDENPNVRAEAVRFFAQIGAEDDETRIAIVQRLDDKHPSVRQAAVRFFAQIGAEDAETRNAVVQRLDDENPNVRAAAVRFLTKIDAEDDEIRTAIAQRLDDENPYVRSAAVRFLTQIGAEDDETRSAIARRLEDTKSNVRAAAVRFFVQIGAEDDETRTAVAQRLDDSKPNVRAVAERFFARQDQRQRLEGENPYVRAEAVRFLTQIGAEDDETRTAVAPRLDDEHPSVRDAAVRFFAQIGADDTETRTAVAQRLDDEHPSVRAAAVRFLTQIGVNNHEIRTAVVQRLDDENPDVRHAAVRFFEELGADDSETHTAVAQRLDDENLPVRHAAMRCLTQIGADNAEIRTAVAQRLDDENPDLRHAAVRFLAQIEANDAEIRTAVAQRLDDEKPSVRHAAVRFLAQIGNDDAETQSAVAQRLDDEHPSVRAAALHFLAQIGNDDAETQTAVAQRLDDENPSVRAAALRFFVEVRAEDPEIRTAVAQRLDDENLDVRTKAMRSLAAIGADDAEIRTAVAQRLDDKNQDVRNAALEFLANHELDPSMASAVLEVLSTSTYTSEAASLKISTLMGKTAGTYPSVLELVLRQGQEIPHFDFDLCLRHAALQRDRLRRKRIPLELLA